jgi:predicted transcriptional regulator
MQQLTVRLDDTTMAALRDRAREEDRPPAVLARRLIAAGLKRR